MEEEIIDKDFTKSYWLALQFWVQTNRIFTVGVPEASHGINDKSKTITKKQKQYQNNKKWKNKKNKKQKTRKQENKNTALKIGIHVVLRTT